MKQYTVVSYYGDPEAHYQEAVRQRKEAEAYWHDLTLPYNWVAQQVLRAAEYIGNLLSSSSTRNA